MMGLLILTALTAAFAVPAAQAQDDLLQTAKRMAAEFRSAGFAVTEKVGGNAVVGVFANGPGPTLMIRTNMDGLPVKEATSLSYASITTGKDKEGTISPIVHACGHDVHMTVLIGAVGHLYGDTKRNIISDDVKLELTVRSYSDETRRKLLDGIKRIAEAQARSAGVPSSLYPVITMADTPTPATYNTEKQSNMIDGVFRAQFGSTRVIKVALVMGGEDFSFFWLADKSIESTMFWLGTVKQSTYDAALKNNTSLPSLHSAKFAPDPEPSIRTGVTAMTSAAFSIFNTK